VKDAGVEGLHRKFHNRGARSRNRAPKKARNFHGKKGSKSTKIDASAHQ